MRVQVSRVDLDGRKIDFRMVTEGEDAALQARARREKFGGGDKHAGVEGELASIKHADRALKTAARSRAGKGAHLVRAGKGTASAKPAKRR